MQQTHALCGELAHRGSEPFNYLICLSYTSQMGCTVLNTFPASSLAKPWYIPTGVDPGF